MDIRADAARYYDLAPHTPDDLDFYRSLVPSPEAAVLELGCGTGRVLLPLSEQCSYTQGIDCSEGMLEICRNRLSEAQIPETRAVVQLGDISDYDLGRRFDLIIAPFRVIQNLETDEQLAGLFSCIRKHLAPGGACVLNVFRPYRDAATIRSEWEQGCEEFFRYEAPTEQGRVVCTERWERIDPDRMVLYPTLVYREYAGDELLTEALLPIAMRCFYPDQFLELISGYGFQVVRTWGGYAGQSYGEGPELVVQFTDGKNEGQ